MTIVVDSKKSDDGLRCVNFEWEKSGTYHVIASERVTADSPLAHQIQRSREYAFAEHDKAKATFRRYCKKYL